MKTLLTSSKYIKEQTEITDNLDDNRILPAIRKAQDIDLQYVIGSSMLSRLQRMVEDGSVVEDENRIWKELIEDYIQPYLSYLVIAELCLVAGQKVSNIGIVETTDEHTQNLTLADRMQLRDYYLQNAASYCGLLQRFIIKNITTFSCSLCSDDVLRIQANLNSSSETSIWTGGVRGKGRHSKRWSDM